MIAAVVAVILLGGIATRLLATGLASDALSGVRRPQRLGSIWVISLVWIAAIALLAGIAVAR